MNKKFKLLFIILTITILSGCYNSSKKAVEKYLNDDLKPIISIQDEVISEYENLLKTKDLNLNTMLNTLDNSIIPKYKKFVKLLENISSESKEVNKVHEILVNGAKNQLNAFITLSDGLSNKDTDIIYHAEKLLQNAKAYMSDFNRSINELKDNY